MELVRIGEKLISVTKIHNMVQEVLQARGQGLSQSEVAQRFGVDRTFVSRLEAVGEIRKGRSIAVIGFPVANTEAVGSLCRELGVDFCWVMTDAERRDYAQSRNGIEIINELMTTARTLRTYDAVVLLASNTRLRLMEALLDSATVVPIVLGETPLTRDVPVDLDVLGKVIRGIRPLSAGEP